MAIELKFEGKKRMIGNSWMVTIPKGVADLLDQDKEYKFLIQENNSPESEEQ